MEKAKKGGEGGGGIRRQVCNQSHTAGSMTGTESAVRLSERTLAPSALNRLPQTIPPPHALPQPLWRFPHDCIPRRAVPLPGTRHEFAYHFPLVFCKFSQFGRSMCLLPLAPVLRCHRPAPLVEGELDIGAPRRRLFGVPWV